MKKYVLIFVISIFSFFNKGSNYISANDSQNQNINNVNTVDTSSQFMPTHMVIERSWTNSEPRTSSRIIQVFPQGILVSVIDTETVVSLRGIETSWSKVRNSRGVIGWIISERLREVEQSLLGLPMNRIDNPIITLRNRAGEDHQFILDSEYGRFAYKYGMNRLYINFFRKDVIFDDAFNIFNDYWKDRFFEMETSIAHQFDIFPIYSHSQRNIRKNIKNGITFIDSFIFAMSVLEDQRLVRDIFLTTHNYNIRITIFIPSDSEQEILFFNETMNRIMNEAPHYFRINIPTEDAHSSPVILYFTEENIGKGDIIWDDFIQFGEGLINGTNLSETTKVWFNETEEIINNRVVR